MKRRTPEYSAERLVRAGHIGRLMTILRCWMCGEPVDSAAEEFCAKCREELSRSAR